MSLKGPAIAESDNLNPWAFKRERAPRSKNTAPSASSTSVTFERMEALHNRYEAAPAYQGELAPQQTIRAVGNAETELKPSLQETVNTQECEPVKESVGEPLGPQVVSRETLAVQVAPTLRNEVVTNPAASKDLLEGYEERFFLKQDGYDDP